MRTGTTSMRSAIAGIAALLLLAVPSLAGDLDEAVKNLGSKDSATRISAKNLLSSRKDPSAIPLIVDAAPGFDLIGRLYAVMVLDVYPHARSVPAYRALLKTGDPYLELCGATGLYRAGERGAAAAVARALHAGEVDANTRVYMLNRVISDRDPAIRAAVREFLQPGAEVAILGAALNVLANGGGEAEISAAERLRKDPRPGVRGMAAALQYRLGRDDRVPELAELIASGEMEYSPFSRVRSLLYVMPALAEPILEAYASLLAGEETNVNVLNSSIGLLGKYRYRGAIPALRELLDHENRLVGKNAFEALAGMPGALDPATLLPLLESKDADRRLQAAAALRRMDDPAGFDVVLEILKNGENLQRADAADVLSGFREARAVEPLIDALLDDYETTRMRAEYGLATVLRSLYPYRRFDLKTTGYARNASPETRRQAVERIRAWWRKNRDSDW